MESASFEEKAYHWGLPMPFAPTPVREKMVNVASGLLI